MLETSPRAGGVGLGSSAISAMDGSATCTGAEKISLICVYDSRRNREILAATQYGETGAKCDRGYARKVMRRAVVRWGLRGVFDEHTGGQSSIYT